MPMTRELSHCAPRNIASLPKSARNSRPSPHAILSTRTPLLRRPLRPLLLLQRSRPPREIPFKRRKEASATSLPRLRPLKRSRQPRVTRWRRPPRMPATTIRKGNLPHLPTTRRQHQPRKAKDGSCSSTRARPPAPSSSEWCTRAVSGACNRMQWTKLV